MHLITFPGKVLEEMFAHMQSGDMTIGSEDTASPCSLYGGGGGGLCSIGYVVLPEAKPALPSVESIP